MTKAGKEIIAGAEQALAMLEKRAMKKKKKSKPQKEKRLAKR